MAAWDLDDAAWDTLDELRFSTDDADVFRNATMILMTDVGRSKFDIAEDLGCTPATVVGDLLGHVGHAVIGFSAARERGESDCRRGNKRASRHDAGNRTLVRRACGQIFAAANACQDSA